MSQDPMSAAAGRSPGAPAGAGRRSCSGCSPSRLCFLPPGKHLILNEIAILALFALSLDLILGYAGIVSLGHAAFFGVGAYAAGLLCQARDAAIRWPVSPSAIVAAAVLGFVTSFLVLRGSDLTRLMVTLGVALVLDEIANALPQWSPAAPTACRASAMGPLLGHFEFDLYGRTAYAYSLTTLFVLFLLARRVVHSPFGLSLIAIRRNPLRAVGARRAGPPPSDRGLHARRGLCRCGRRAARADHGLRLARRAGVPSLGRRAAGADHRRHGLAVWRHRRRDRLQGAAGHAVVERAAVLDVLDRAVPRRAGPGRPRAPARRGIGGGVRQLLARARR